MANLQRLLGTMLMTRMAGRGRLGGALGTAAMLGGLGGGRRRGGGGVGRTAGLAALGYLAYRAYQNSQQNQPEQPGPGGAGPAAGSARSASGGGIGGAIGGLIDSIAGGGAARSPAGSGPSLGERIGNVLGPRSTEPEPDQAALGDQKALLLIRAMIAAANSDGQITPQERQRILAKMDEAGADADDHRVIEQELRSPAPLDSLLREVNDPETAQQFYLASRIAVEGSSDVQQSYLAYLRQRLGLSPEDVAEVEEMAAPA